MSALTDTLIPSWTVIYTYLFAKNFPSSLALAERVCGTIRFRNRSCIRTSALIVPSTTEGGAALS